jgi:hypothetical protein
MSSSTESFLFLVFILVLIVGSIVISYFISQGRRKAWQDLSERIGATYAPGSFWFGRPVVSGVYQQHTFKLDTFRRGTGKSSTTYTRLEVMINNPNFLSMSIHQEGLMSKIGKAFGVQDIQLGDEELDQRFIIKGQPESDVRRVFASLGMRQRLLEAPELHADVIGQVIRHEKRGYESDPNTLIALLDVLCAMANAIDRPQI